MEESFTMVSLCKPEALRSSAATTCWETPSFSASSSWESRACSRAAAMRSPIGERGCFAGRPAAGMVEK